MRAKRISGGLQDAKVQVPWNRAKDRKNGQKPGTTVPQARLFLSKCHHIGAARATIGKRDFSANMAEYGALVDLEKGKTGECLIQTTLNQAGNPGSGSGSASNRAATSWSDLRA